MAYSRSRPFGPDMDNWRMARLCTAIYGAGGTKTKISDFMPKFESAKQSSRDMLGILKRLASGSSSNSND